VCVPEAVTNAGAVPEEPTAKVWVPVESPFRLVIPLAEGVDHDKSATSEVTDEMLKT
jgi:hypothetical protein